MTDQPDDARISELYERAQRGDYPTIAEVEEVTGPLPRTRGEALAELIKTTGLSAAELERITGLDLTSRPDEVV